jgi:hypothetical protein
MLALLNFRNYIIIAFIVAGLLAAIVYFDTGRTLVGYVNNSGNTAAQALGQQVTSLVTAPIAWAMSDYVGAIVAALLWPLGVVWLILFVALFVFSIFAPAIGGAMDLPGS